VGQKTVRFSDLSGELITHDDVVARIVIRQHPGLGDRPVEIEAHADEARVIEKAAVRLALVDLYLPGEVGPRQVAMDADAFDKLATDRAMGDVLLAARPARRGSRANGASGASGTTVAGERAAYANLDQAGTPHRGRITEAEKRLVRERFDEINQRLAGQGLRTINLDDPEHVERYGLHDLAASRAIAPQ
jgi:hypothetical protein